MKIIIHLRLVPRLRLALYLYFVLSTLTARKAELSVSLSRLPFITSFLISSADAILIAI